MSTAVCILWFLIYRMSIVWYGNSLCECVFSMACVRMSIFFWTCVPHDAQQIKASSFVWPNKEKRAIWIMPGWLWELSGLGQHCGAEGGSSSQCSSVKGVTNSGFKPAEQRNIRSIFPLSLDVRKGSALLCPILVATKCSLGGKCFFHTTVLLCLLSLFAFSALATVLLKLNHKRNADCIKLT